MSEEDKDLLNRRFPQLISKISIEDGMLLAHLRSRGALTQQQEEHIKSKGDRSNQVRCLLDVLLKGDSNIVDKLIYSLRATDQSNVVDEWLRQPRQPDFCQLVDTGNGGATNFLSEADAKLLEKNRPRLMGDVKLVDGSLLAMLRSRAVLTETEEWVIKGLQGSTGNSTAVGRVVDFLLRKRPNSLEEFLHALNHCGHSFVVEYLRPPSTPDESRYVRGGQSTPEFQAALQHNTRDRLQEWRTALEESVSDGERLLPYIEQPCSILQHGQQSHRPIIFNLPSPFNTLLVHSYPVPNAVELVENRHPGERIIIYGEAGMGKTTLLKQLARSWIEGGNSELAKRFTYVFFIPLRRVGQGTLPHIICDELKLLPEICLEDLKKSLQLCEHRVLFLLDSYEELREDVVKAKKTDVDDLITGRLYPKSTVVVTSRPGSKLKQSEDQITAQLKDLPETEVRTIIEQHFGENKYAVYKVQCAFPAMAYLQKPINLALFIFIITRNKHLTLAYTQAELFSLVLQYIMLAFAKKKKLEEFTPQAGSYITNKAIPRDIRRLFRDIAKKCYEERKENNVILHVEDNDDLKEYLDFGLFTAGTDTNTVLLPHRLFVEYFAAAHLAENRDALTALLEKIKEKSESESPRLLLPDVVRALGLENVLRFVVALSPQSQQEKVCEQIGSLFVLDRKKIKECDNFQLVDFEDYYTELIRDCGDERAKRVLTTALLNAPVRDVKVKYTMFDRSHVLLPHLDYNQCVTFLKKVYNLDLSVIDGKSTLSCTGTGDNKRLGISDRFVVGFIHWYDCTIKADEVYIKDCDLPTSIFKRMSSVHYLRLDWCNLCEGLLDYMKRPNMPDQDMAATILHHSSATPPCMVAG